MFTQYSLKVLAPSLQQLTQNQLYQGAVEYGAVLVWFKQ